MFVYLRCRDSSSRTFYFQIFLISIKYYLLSYTRFTYLFIYLFIYLRCTLCLIFLIIIVPPELVAQTIKAMNDNKSPRVDEIHPTLLMETVEQISIPLPRVFNLPVKKGLFHLNGKKQISCHYLKRVRELQTIEFNVSDL